MLQRVWARAKALMALGLVLALGAGAAAQGRIVWQSNLEATPHGFRMGLRDKNGDMTRNYRVFFQVVTPLKQEFTIYREVPAGHDEFVEVDFPRDFGATPGALVPGDYVCVMAVNQVPTVREKFRWRAVGGQGVIEGRQTWFAGSGVR